jgi:hypothetical protein
LNIWISFVLITGLSGFIDILNILRSWPYFWAAIFESAIFGVGAFWVGTFEVGAF